MTFGRSSSLAHQAALSLKRDVETLLARGVPGRHRRRRPGRRRTSTPSSTSASRMRSEDRATTSGRGLAEYAARFDGLSDVIDVGCGRGEFLELLKARGVPRAASTSITRWSRTAAPRASTRPKATRCGSSRHSTTRASAACSRRRSSSICSPVTCAKLLETAAHKVRPGGLVILETINPACWVAFFESFVRDITHVWPLHPETLQYLMRASGFRDVTIEYRSPVARRGAAAAAAAPGLGGTPPAPTWWTRSTRTCRNSTPGSSATRTTRSSPAGRNAGSLRSHARGQSAAPVLRSARRVIDEPAPHVTGAFAHGASACRSSRGQRGRSGCYAFPTDDRWHREAVPNVGGVAMLVPLLVAIGLIGCRRRAAAVAVGRDADVRARAGGRPAADSARRPSSSAQMLRRGAFSDAARRRFDHRASDRGLRPGIRLDRRHHQRREPARQHRRPRGRRVGHRRHVASCWCSSSDAGGTHAARHRDGGLRRRRVPGSSSTTSTRRRSSWATAAAICSARSWPARRWRRRRRCRRHLGAGHRHPDRAAPDSDLRHGVRHRRARARGPQRVPGRPRSHLAPARGARHRRAAGRAGAVRADRASAARSPLGLRGAAAGRRLGPRRRLRRGARRARRVPGPHRRRARSTGAVATAAVGDHQPAPRVRGGARRAARSAPPTTSRSSRGSASRSSSEFLPDFTRSLPLVVGPPAAARSGSSGKYRRVWAQPRSDRDLLEAVPRARCWASPPR